MRHQAMEILKIILPSSSWARAGINYRPALIFQSFMVALPCAFLLWYLQKPFSRHLSSKTTQPTNKLCKKCRNISLDEMRGPGFDRMQPHQPCVWDVRLSAMRGCQLCGFIWTAFGQEISEADREKASEALTYISEEYPGRGIFLTTWGGSGASTSLDCIQFAASGEIPEEYDENGDLIDASIDLSMHPEHQTGLSGVLDLFAYPDDAAVWHGGITGRPLPTSAGDLEPDFDFVRSCLKECHSAHPTCCTTPNACLPTRILDVGDGSREPYLLESQGIQGRYAALSHCWGGSVPLTTTTRSLESHKSAVPVASLPPTFRDAVQICRELGIRYLWIDSLCILQDSKEDWEKESATMADVYGGSYLTIAARAAKTAADGCFIPRKKMPPPCRLEYRSPDGTVTGSMYIADPASPIELISETPLDKRGWVLQERILSPRIVYYGAEQIYWECRQSTKRQDGKFYVIQQEKLKSEHFKQSLDPHTDIKSIFHGSFSRQQPDWTDKQLELACRMDQWYHLVQEYCRRSLSYESDRLPALAGIAKEFARSTGCNYILGIWREQIMAGLLWYQSDVLRQSSPHQHLPSWSWVRFTGKITFWSSSSNGFLHYIKENDDCEFVDLSYRHTSPLGDYGQVCDAKLTLRGRIIPANYSNMLPSEPHMSPGEFMMDTQGRRMGEVRFDINYANYQQAAELFCLVVQSKPYNGVGLVLERVVGGDKDTYRRVALYLCLL